MPLYYVIRAVTAKSVAEAIDLKGELVSIQQASPIYDQPVPEAARQPFVEKATAARIKASIAANYLTSFEDGKGYKTLKRHLAKAGLTPEQYREKWGLPADYPMVAPAYSERRSALAKAAGLGRK